MAKRAQNCSDITSNQIKNEIGIVIPLNNSALCSYKKQKKNLINEFAK